jgi:2-polyprenyl-6-methoxyphenol hydroxylase-like FAD-dependent oxidoreductase
MDTGSSDVIVVGAGPTGLALATGLHAFGTRSRIIDRRPERNHDSRALAIQPRTLEVLTGIGIAQEMIERGNPGVRLQLHSRGRSTELPLFDIGLDDTAYPFLLFLSQAETEAILERYLATRGTLVERGVELVGLAERPDAVTCELRHLDGTTEHLDAAYVVGCDGAHSTVRHHAGIAFPGSTYPQTFVLADLAADGLDRSAVHAYLSAAGMLFFFPLGDPAPWRLLGMRPHHESSATGTPSLDELQALTDTYTTEPIELADPVWATNFRLHLRHADRYRTNRIFVAGDAAHVHSPAGAQGMNTGIQDACNLAWKLAWVTNHSVDPALLDTYQAERQPIGRDVLRLTNRAFTIATSTNPAVTAVRTHLAPRLMHLALRSTRFRGRAFRTLAQLTVNYRHSPLSQSDTPLPRRGPRAGDRLPDSPIVTNDLPTTLHQVLSPPGLHVLTSGATPAGQPRGTAGWANVISPALVDRLHVHHLTHQPAPDALVDPTGEAHQRLGLHTGQPAQLLVRPDGHISYRATCDDLDGLRRHLRRWFGQFGWAPSGPRVQPPP